MNLYLGIDNGVTGSYALLDEKGIVLFHGKMPTKSELSYTKAKQNITRLDYPKWLILLHRFENETEAGSRIVATIERPMVNPMRFKASVSAVRCLEAVLIGLECIRATIIYLDSKAWQRDMLPKGIEKDELKVASFQVASRLFPKQETITKDISDSILMAEWSRRKNL